MKPNYPDELKPHPIAKAFLQNRHLLVLTIVIILVAGLAALRSLPRLEDPIITNRYPDILTLFPGASAERVEALVTEPIERALHEVAAIRHVDSFSRTGMSFIAIELDDWVKEADNEAIFSDIRDRVAAVAAGFPAGVQAPVFDDKRAPVAFGLIVALTWRNGAEEALGILGRQATELADRLRRVPGTELVRVYGEPTEEIEVTMDAHEFLALGLTAEQLASALRMADAKTPAGIVRAPDLDFLVEVAGELDSLDRIRQAPLTTAATARQVRVADVAEVRRVVREPAATVALANGHRAVLVAARVRADSRMDLWSDQARAVVDAFAEEAGPGIVVTQVFDQERYTSARLSELGTNLVFGGVVIFLILLLTMGWRSAWIVGLALPLSAALTLFVVSLGGGALHQMSIFGMIIALGLLIDNSIVMTHTVRANLSRGLAPLAAVSAALRHLLLPLLSATLTTLLAFMPILLLPGGTGDFVRSIGTSVIVALSASFFVAVTLIGGLAGWCGHRTTPEQPRGRLLWLAEGVRAARLTGWIRRALIAALRRPALTVALSLIIPALGFLLASTLGSQFFPRTDRDMFQVKVWLPKGSSVDRTRAAVTQLEALLRRHGAVQSVHWLVGASYPSVYYNLIMDQDGSPHFAQGIIRVREASLVNDLVEGLQCEFDQHLPDAQVVVAKFAQGPPTRADVEFRIYGPVLGTLQELGEEVRRQLANHPGVLHTQVTLPRGEPKLWLDLNEDEVRRAGLRLTEVADQLNSRMEGTVGGVVLEGLEDLPVRVRLDRAERSDPAALAHARLLTPAAPGKWVPISVLGERVARPELGGISRRDGERVNKVLGFARSDTLPIETARDVMRQIEAAGLRLPAGYRLELGGESESQAQAVGDLLIYLPVLVVATVAVLILSFRSVRAAIILLLVAPLSAGYGLLATWALQLPLSFNSVLGSLGLMGLAFNSSVIVLAALRAHGPAAAGEPLAMVTTLLGNGRHLLSTTLTTMGSFLPLLLLVGGQFWPPLAIVLAGGVAGSTLLALTFTPALYRLLCAQRITAKTGPTDWC